MLYLIGLGLNFDSISKFGLEVAQRCKKVYLETYTVDFPYNKVQLQEVIGKKLIEADREKVESLELVDEAQKMDICLLIYGSPLTATTHITLIQEAKRMKVRSKIIYNASILDAVAETGLQLYKFGKIASMPKWKKHFTPDSFIKTVQENMSMNAHSLILIDIGLDITDALDQLEKAAKIHKFNLKNIVICQNLGTKTKRILQGTLEELKKYENVRKPYCLIIPSKLHFVEKEFLDEIS
jgi:diphthine synthase